MQLAVVASPACSTSCAARRLSERSRRPLRVAAASAGGSGFGGQPQVRASRVPSPDEDKEVMHAAYMNAYGQSHHGPRIKGMQEFAGALLARERIPSGAYSDPLAHIFDEFDADADGALTAVEVAAALRSRQVDISDEQAAQFIDAVDLEHHAITKGEFRDLIMHMAAADLHTRRAEHAAGEGGPQGEWVMSSWEQDEEIVNKLKSWTEHLMSRRFK